MKWRVGIKCDGKCDFDIERTVEGEYSDEAKMLFLNTFDEKESKKYFNHTGHKDTKICEEIQ